MKTVAVSPRSKAVHSLLKKASPDGLILESPDGDRYVLAPLKGWVGFDVGNSEDFGKEALLTARNKKLIKHLADRRHSGKRIPLEEARKQLARR